jgi:hypothetical protein
MSQYIEIEVTAVNVRGKRYHSIEFDVSSVGLSLVSSGVNSRPAFIQHITSGNIGFGGQLFMYFMRFIKHKQSIYRRNTRLT